jgi:hypothetical protein
VRGEDDVSVGASDPPRDQVEERRMVVPAFDHHGLRALAHRLDQAVAIAADRDARIVRGEDEAHDPLRAGLDGVVGRLGDARRPVLHADVDRGVELVLERGALALGDLVQG